MENRLPISVMIVGYNEAHFLRPCLDSVSFCNEIIYTDLGSTDDSIEIARRYTENVYIKDKKNVPSCEIVQAEVIHITKNDWVIFIDPDERVDEVLARQIADEFNVIKKNDKVGAVMVPWQFYFKTKKLRGTVWGGVNKKYFLVNKYKFSFLPTVHYGRTLKQGFNVYEINENKQQTNLLHHYWMNSYKVFIKKHFRYLKNEGIDNYNLGVRVAAKKIILVPFKEFYFSFIDKKGYKDLFIGFFLSLFWAFYKTYIAVDIFMIQQKKR